MTNLRGKGDEMGIAHVSIPPPKSNTAHFIRIMHKHLLICTI